MSLIGTLGIFKGRRLFLSTIFVISIASSLFVFNLGYVDTIGNQILQDYTSKVNIDAVIYMPKNEIIDKNISNDNLEWLQSRQYIDGVEEVSTILFKDINNITLKSSQLPLWSGSERCLGINQSFLDCFPNYLDIVNGSLIDQENGVLVHTSLANILNLTYGENITINMEKVVFDNKNLKLLTFPYMRNVTIIGFFNEGNNAEYSEGSNSKHSSPGFLMDSEYAQEINMNFTNTYNWTLSTDCYYLSIDHSVINYLIPLISGTTLYTINQEISQEITPSIRFYLFGAYQSFETWMNTSRITILLYFVPLLIIASILIYTIIHFAIVDNQNQLDRILARGAKESQIKSMLLREILKIGAISGLIGIGIGWGIGQLGMSIEGFLIFNFSQLINLNFTINLTTIPLCWIFPFVLVIISNEFNSYLWIPKVRKNIKRKRIIPEAEKSRKIKSRKKNIISDESKEILLDMLIKLNPLFMFFALIGASSIVIFVFFGINPLLSPTEIVTLTIVGFFISFGTLHLISHVGKKIFRIIPTKWRNRCRLVSTMRGISKVTQRSEGASYLIIILTLVIALGLGAGIASSTFNLSALDQANYRVGADIQLISGLTDNPVNLDFTKNLTSIDGVMNIAEIKIALANVGNERPTYLIGLNIMEYIEMSYSNPGTPLEETSKKDLFQLIKNNPNLVIISDQIGIDLNKNPGDNLNIAFTLEDGSEEEEITVKQIGGRITDLAGFSRNRFIIFDIDILMDLLNSTQLSRFLIEIEPDTNSTLIAEEIESKFSDHFSEIDVANDIFESWVNADFFIWFDTVTTMSFIYTSIFTCLYFIVYLDDTFTRKKRDLALLRSMGLSKKQMIILSVSEISQFIIISIIMGSLIGILGAWLTNNEILVAIIGKVIGIPRLGFNLETIFLVFSLPIGLSLGGALFVILRFINHNIAQMIKTETDFIRGYRVRV
ncbi:MAG: FtsX-like permease family protein [Candidatus Ranarchaeia archaeon]